MSEKAIVTCALTGVLTDPKKHSVPVSAKEMATAAREAFDAGAGVLHCHFRRQEAGKGHLPTWDTEVVSEICNEIRNAVPEILINMSTGITGKDISGPVSCLRTVRPDIAALNSGSLNYLKLRSDGSWAWPPLLFDNEVDKICDFLKVMDELDIVPECECFDTGIVRSVGLFQRAGLIKGKVHISFVMGVESGMPAKPNWLPLLIDELPEKSHWQVIAIGREEVWSLHKKACDMGGNVRTGLEDTFYLPDGSKTDSNAKLIEALVGYVRDSGREVASPAETRSEFNISN